MTTDQPLVHGLAAVNARTPLGGQPQTPEVRAKGAR